MFNLTNKFMFKYNGEVVAGALGCAKSSYRKGKGMV